MPTHGQREAMTEGAYRLYDTIIKAVTAVVAIGAALYGLLQYVDSARNNKATQTLEQAKLAVERSKLALELNRQKADILSRGAQAAADATWATDNSIRLEAINRFTRLFVGEVSLVANKEVNDNGDRLNDILDEVRGFLDPEYGRTVKYADPLPGQLDPAKQKDAYRRQVEENAIMQTNAFVKACRDQIASSLRDDTAYR